MEIIQHALENTTQLGWMHRFGKMMRHFKSLMPFLNQPHLAEMVATDTCFTDIKDVNGWTCMQALCRLASHFVNPCGLQKESDNLQALQDFAREEGIPTVICMDNARPQQCGWLSMLRKWLTSAEFLEPGQQSQNPVEPHAVKWIEGSAGILLKQTGAPACAWGDGTMCMSEIHNIVSDETLLWKTPWHK